MSIQPAAFAELPVSVRADLLYRATRLELDGRLWQAALGITSSAGAAAPRESPAPALLRLETLIEALVSEDRLQPQLAPVRSEPARNANPPSSGRLQLGVNQHLAPALERAAARVGLDPAVLASIVDAEAARRSDGSWYPASRNPRSSAAGLGQFLSGTWLAEAARPGTWLRATAEERGWISPDGVIKPEARTSLLSLRFDPTASIEAIADHASANLRQLRARSITPTSMPDIARAAYLAHHLGLGDALRYLGGGLGEGRAERLLVAQVGSVAANRRIASTGSAAQAHRAWLDHYVDQRIRPARYFTA